MAPTDPATALDRIAYLLERGQASTYRVRAFRNAAEALRRAGPEAVAGLARSGRLTSLQGLGATTADISAEVLAGRVPAYLEELEAQGDRPDTPEEAAAAALTARLLGDLHAHSDWSDGGSPIDVMAAAARDLGRRYLALTDHSPRLRVARGLSAERLVAQLEVVDEVNQRLAPFLLLKGIEVDILADGGLDQDDELLGQLDVVVASVHSELRMESPAMTARLVRAVRNPRVSVLGHCTGRIILGKGRPPSTFDAGAVFSACAEGGTAVEINSRPERLDPPDELLGVAVEAGCRFSIDTDAHAPGQLEWLNYGARKAVACGVDADSIVTTWDVDRLLVWAREVP